MLPGGFKPKNNIPVGSVVYRGVLVEVNFSEMSAAVIKIASVLSGGTTSKPRIAKGHLFAVGDVIAKVGKERYIELSTRLGCDLAEAYVNHRMSMRMVDYEVDHYRGQADTSIMYQPA